MGDPFPGRGRRARPGVRVHGRRRLGALGLTLAPVDSGTRLTESWEFLPAGLARFRERYGADAQAQIGARTEAAHAGIPVTLAAIKKTAESA